MPSSSRETVHIPPILTQPSTPAWSPSESSTVQSEMSPAWDPSSRTPRTPAFDRPSHWLDDPIFRRLRLKLKTDDPAVQSPHVEFLGIENDLVKIRDKLDIKFLGFDSIHPLLPTSPGDLVIAKTGEMRGVHFSIIRLTGDTCVVRKPGCRPTKKNPDPEFPISDLLQVYPAPCHR